MSKPTFYLKSPNQNNDCLIVLVYNFNYQRLKISTQISIKKKYWNKHQQQVSSTLEGYEEMNEKLAKVSSTLMSAHNEIKKETINPSPVLLREKYNQLNNPIQPKTSQTFWEFFDEFVEYQRGRIKDVRDYHNSLKKHLKHVEVKKTKTELTFDKLKENTPFMKDYIEWLHDEAVNSEGEFGLMTNTIGKYNKNLRTFLNWMFNNKGLERFGFDHLPLLTEEFEPIYLTKNELVRFENVSPENADEKIIKSLFLVGIYTGLRFSDYSTLKPENVRGNRLHINPTKTRNSRKYNNLIIPIEPNLESILNNPPNYSKGITEFNKGLRKLCKRAEINSTVSIYRIKGDSQTENFYKKYERISSHSARRTFCTLNYLDGVPVKLIMKISSHTTEKSFFRYINLDAEDAANEFEKVKKELYNEKNIPLKVA